MLKAILNYFNPEPAAVVGIYHNVMTAARTPRLYEGLGVPDTLDGRFELACLFAILLMRRLSAYPEQNQELFDLMFQDFDQALREMGVGDTGVPKRMQAMIGAFYGRANIYEKALIPGADPQALLTALSHNVYGSLEAPPSLAQLSELAEMVKRNALHLTTYDDDDLLTNHFGFLT